MMTTMRASEKGGQKSSVREREKGARDGRRKGGVREREVVGRKKKASGLGERARERATKRKRESKRY